MPSANTMLREANIERVPPQNLEAEAGVLGAMLLEESSIAEVVDLLDPASFYKEAHQKIFNCILSLYNERRSIDVITLTDALRQRGELDAVGGAGYIAELATAVPTAANVRHHARIVKDKALARHLIRTATQIVTDSFESSADIYTLLDRAEKNIFDIALKRIETTITPIKEIIKDSIEAIDELYQRKAHVTGLGTGFNDLDVMTAGLQKSDLIVVAGRPSMGKSAFVCSIAERVAVIEKKPVAFFSLEMSKEQLVQRMLCSYARVEGHRVRTGFLGQADWPKLTSAAGKLSEAPIYIDDTAAISALEIRAKARRLKSRFDIQLVVVDYLQLMRGSSGVENRQQEISGISMSLKALARELSVPVIAISQLSRAVESRSDHRPQLSDLRESGAIEQDADVVILLLREEYYLPTEENKGKAEVIIAKQRNGPVGSLELAFLKEFTRFANLAKMEYDTPL